MCRTIGLILARRPPGNRSDFQAWVARPLGQGTTSFTLTGDYDFGLLHETTEPIDRALVAIRSLYSRVLDAGFDARLTIAMDPVIKKSEQPSDPLSCITLLRLNEGYLRAGGPGQLHQATAYIQSLAKAIRDPGALRLFPAFGLLDLLLVQRGKSYNEMFDLIRLVRASTLGDLDAWSRAPGRDAPPPKMPSLDGAPAVANHICVATYTVLGFKWDLERQDLERSTVISRPPPVPITLVSFNPGHEVNRLDGSSDESPVDTVGLFDRLESLVKVANGAAEADVVAALAALVRRTNTSDEWAREHCYAANTLWRLPIPKPAELTKLLEGTEFAGRLVHAKVAPHRHLVDTRDFTCGKEWLGVVNTALALPLGPQVQGLLRHLSRVYQAYDLLVNSEFLFPTVDDLYPFLSSFARSMPGLLLLNHSEPHKLERPLRLLVDDLSACLSHRQSVTTFSFKPELSFLDSSVMHKVQRMLSVVARSIFAWLAPHMSPRVEAFVYAGAVRRMESEALLGDSDRVFVVLRIGSDDLFSPASIFDLLHEVAHFLFFKSFDANSWLLAFVTSVARSTVHTLKVTLTELERDEVVRTLEEALSGILRKAGPERLHRRDGCLGTVRRASIFFDSYLQTPSFIGGLSDHLRERGDIAPTFVKWWEARGNRDEFIASAIRAVALWQRQFTEAIPDVIALGIAGDDAYLKHLEEHEHENRRDTASLLRKVIDPSASLGHFDVALVVSLRAIRNQFAPILEGLRTKLRLSRLLDLASIADWHEVLLEFGSYETTLVSGGDPS